MHHSEWYNEAVEKAEKVGTTPHMPCIVERQSQQNNVQRNITEDL